MKAWKFWSPSSGPVGGLIMGVVIALTVLFFLPPITFLLKWWFSVWGV